MTTESEISSPRELCTLQCKVVVRMLGENPEWDSCNAWCVEEYCMIGKDPNSLGFRASRLMSRHTLLRPTRWQGIDVRVNAEQLLLPHLQHTLTMGDERLVVLEVVVSKRIVRIMDQRTLQYIYPVRMGTVAPPQQGYAVALQRDADGYVHPTLA